MPIENKTLAKHQFLAGMYRDGYFPDRLVDKGKEILIRFCEQIEAQSPLSDDAFQNLADQAVNQFNDLQDEFEAEDSEIETVARDVIGEDFVAIAAAYGFGHLDGEDIIGDRDW